MEDLNDYFSSLQIRAIDQFRDDTTTKQAEKMVPENQQGDSIQPAATEQGHSMAATDDAAANTGDETNQPGATAEPDPRPSQPTSISALVAADEAANGFHGVRLPLLRIPERTARERSNNRSREVRVVRLATEYNARRGSERWFRNGRAYAQPAVPRSVARNDGSGVVEYNQFMRDKKTGEAVLRMPDGWQRDLVRNRREFLGVAVIDGFFWPRFRPGLPKPLRVDWGKSNNVL
jgi:hypothetical protein